MSFRINTNVTAMTALNNLNNSSNALDQAITSLSSGLRINSAADDPSGLVVSSKYGAQLAGISSAISNSQDALNLTKTADSALNEVNNLLTQARGLAVSASSTGTLSSTAQQADNAQLQAIISSINNIASTTQFGTKYLLNGSAGTSATVTAGNTVSSLNIQGKFGGAALATSGAATLTVTTAATQAVVTLSKTFATAGTAATAGSFTINGVTINTTTADTEATVQQKINAATSTTGVTASYTTGGGIVLTSSNYGSSTKINVADANGVVLSANGSATGSGTDAVATLTIGSTTATFTGGLNNNNGLTLTDADGNTISLTTQGNTTATSAATVGQVTVGSSTFQIGANAGQTAQLSLGNFAASNLGATAVSGSNVSNISLSSAASSTTALQVLDAAIDQVSSARGAIGAFQNDTLQTNINSLTAEQTNLSAAKSDITDVDMSAEMTVYSKENVLQQAGTTVLAQANSSSQSVLTLLRG